MKPRTDPPPRPALTWAEHLEREGFGRLPTEILITDIERWPVEARLEPTGAPRWEKTRTAPAGPLAMEVWVIAWCAELVNGLMPLMDNLRGSQPATVSLGLSARTDDLQTLARVVERCAARPELQAAALTLLRVAGTDEAALLLYRDDVQRVEDGRRSTRVVAYGDQRLLASALRRHGVNLDPELGR